MPVRNHRQAGDISYLSLVGFFLLLLFIAYALFWSGATRNVDRLIHDSWVRFEQRQAPDDVVIVGIDPKSLSRIGRWPWSRDLQAAFLRRLNDYGIKAAIIDILYVEPDNVPANDIALAKVIGDIPITILPVHTEGLGVHTLQGETLPIPIISNKVTSLGHVSLPLDADGIVRRINLKAGFKTPHWDSLSLAAFNALGGDLQGDDIPGKRLALEVTGNTWVEDHQALISFHGPAKTFTNVGVDEIIAGEVPLEVLKDKIVFIGATATGMRDMLPTAVTSENTPMPGVEIHANIFSALREGRTITTINPVANFAICAVLLVLLLMLYSRLSPIWTLAGAGIGALVPIGISFVLYRYLNIWHAPLIASIPILVSYFLWSWHRLEFLSVFLRHETDRLSDEIGSDDNTNNKLLAQFFKSAQQHLPISGWRFSVDEDAYASTNEPHFNRNAGIDIWERFGDEYARQYRTPGNLKVVFSAKDEEFAKDFMRYVDGLPRVRERQSRVRLAGSIERIQMDTHRLSFQVERLRQLNGLSASLFEGSSAGLVVWSAAGEVVRANDLAKLNLPHIDVESASLIDFLSALGRDPQKQDARRLQELVLEAKPWQVNLIESDSELVINFSAYGRTLVERLISASVIDVTEIRRSERSRAELIDFLSHDLRSPLISSLYMLSDDLRVSENENDEKIERIEHNINRSLEMMDDLLTIARADNLTSEQFSMVLFDSVVDNAVDQLVPQARSRNINIEVEEQTTEVWVNADPALLERAIVNIISNAIKYSPEGTVVDVQSRVSENSIRLDVRDQGIGIAPEMMENLFKRFKRDAAISKQFKGIGLGLALVSRVVTQHGGRVWASNPGKGTLISMEIPVSLVGEYAEDAAI